MARDNVVDNAKAVLIVLVIFGHLLAFRLSESGLYTAIYSALYAFHMPMFIFISGMFSKSELATDDYNSMFARILVPVFLFQACHLAVHFLHTGRLAPLFVPYWILWYLVSLLAWKIALPQVLRLPHYAALGLALLSAVGAGYVRQVGPMLSISRTIVFLPVFLVGKLYGRLLIRHALRHRRLCAIAFILIISGAAWSSFAGSLSYSSFYGDEPYTTIPMHLTEAGLERLAIIMAGICASAAAFALIPPSGRLLGYLGRNTLPIYVLHALLLGSIQKIPQLLRAPSPSIVLPGLLALAFAIAVVLAPLQRLLFDPIASATQSFLNSLRQQLENDG